MLPTIPNFNLIPSHPDDYPTTPASPSIYLNFSSSSPAPCHPSVVPAPSPSSHGHFFQSPYSSASLMCHSPTQSYTVESAGVSSAVMIPSCQPVRTPKMVLQDPPKPSYVLNGSTQRLTSYDHLFFSSVSQVSSPSASCPRTPDDSYPYPPQYPSQPLPSNSFQQHPTSYPSSTYQQPVYPQYQQYPSSHFQQPPVYQQYQQYPSNSYQNSYQQPSNTYPSSYSSYPPYSGYPSYSSYSQQYVPGHNQYAPSGYIEIPANQSPEASVIRTNTPPSNDYQEEGSYAYTQVVQEPHSPYSTLPSHSTQDIEIPDYPCATIPSSTKSPCNIKDKKSFVISVVYAARRIEGLGVTWDDAKGCLHVARENSNITPFLLACRSAFGVRERINKNYYSEFFDDSKECFRRMSGNKKVPKKKPVDVLPNLTEQEKDQFRQYCVAFVEKLKAANHLFREVEGLREAQKFDAFFNGLGNLHEDIC